MIHLYKGTTLAPIIISIDSQVKKNYPIPYSSLAFLTLLYHITLAKRRFSFFNDAVDERNFYKNKL